MSLATRFRFGSQVCSPPGKAVALLLALILITSGCGLHPVTVAHNEPPSFEEDSTLESWLGSNEEDIREQLGQPTWGLQDSDIRYYVYEGMGQAGQIDLFWWIYPPIVIPLPRHPRSEPPPFETWCLRLTFNPALSAYEKLLKPESAEDCRTAFWWPRSISSMESAWKASQAAELQAKAQTGDRAAAFALASEFDDPSYLKALAEEGDREAAFHLASEFHDTASLKILAQEGDIEASKELVKLTGETTKALRELAESGDLAAAILLARYANELGPLKSLAENGKIEAVYILVEEFEQGAYVEKLAEVGNYVAAYERYQRLRSESEMTPTQFLAAWRWLCLSANAGYSKAQAEVGFWHRSTNWENWRGWNEGDLDLLRKVGAQSNDRIAYMWYTLAASAGGESAQHARDYYVADYLTEAERARAEQMARDWMPGDCPSAEHRLGPPGET